jgi:hypothetical protein
MSSNSGSFSVWHIIFGKLVTFVNLDSDTQVDRIPVYFMKLAIHDKHKLCVYLPHTHEEQ